MDKLISIDDERLWSILFDEACIEGQQADRIYKALEEIAQPAFDKENVIKELEYDKEMSKKHSTGLREQGHVEAFDEAISVVKKGGIHNLLP